MVGTFFIMSIFSAEHTMRATLCTPNKRKMLNSLQELSELNVSFHMSDNLAEYQTGITHMLR